MNDIDIKVRFAKSEAECIAAAGMAWRVRDKIDGEGVRAGEVWQRGNDRFYIYKTKTAIVAVCQPGEDEKIEEK